MADITVPTNNVAQPAGAISGNAPPTPPETQDLKTAEMTSHLPPANVQPVSIGEAATTASEPKLGEDGETADPASDAPPAPVPDASKPLDLPQATPSDIQQKIAQAEELTAQPEKPEETARIEADAKLINAETSAPAAASTTDEEAKYPPKPVTIEEVQDADLPAVKPAPVSEPTKTGDSASNTAVSDPKEAKDINVVAVSQAETPPQDVPKPEPAPVPSEPVQAEAKTGHKRKAPEADITDSVQAAALAAAPERQGSPEKKQKLNGPVDNTETSPVKKRRGSKKEKKAPPAVGRTARKTRSQGAAETEKGL